MTAADLRDGLQPTGGDVITQSGGDTDQLDQPESRLLVVPLPLGFARVGTGGHR
jgi:hypothetical protein